MIVAGFAIVLVLGILALLGLLGRSSVVPRRATRVGAAVPRTGLALLVVAAAAAALLTTGNTAGAAIVPTVSLGTASNYAVLGAETVTNTGDSVLDGGLGLSPGTSVVGFPPGIVLPPWTTDVTNAAAAQAQSDLTVAYLDAAGRPIDQTTTADLGGLTLVGGVYAGPDKSALGLTGTLTLDGENNSDSVWIFQTNSSLITESSSTVSLINGAQACNVFWQVGSSATLGTNSTFVGNILALTSVAVTTSTTVEGRALARTGAVTLDDNTFVQPSCEQTPPPTTTTTDDATTTTGVTTTGPGSTTTTTDGATTTTTGVTTTTGPGSTTTTTDGATTTTTGATTTTGPGSTTTTEGATTTTDDATQTNIPSTTGPTTTTDDTASTTTIPAIVLGGDATTTTVSGPAAPLTPTGAPITQLLLLATIAIVLGTLTTVVASSKRAARSVR